jgi:hypothetical protein
MRVADNTKPVGSKKRYWLALLLGAIAFTSPIWLPFASMAAKVFSETYFVRKFDATAWKESLSERGSRSRQKMVDDLLASRQLLGLKRTEVTALLGTPPPTDYFREYDFVYWLGPERGLIGIDSEWLVVKIGGDERVVEAKLVHD